MASNFASIELTPKQILDKLGISQRAGAALRQAGEVLQAVWVEKLSQPGEGKFYEAGIRFFTTPGGGGPRRVVAVSDKSGVQRRRKAHRASKPGHGPATDSGATKASIQVSQTEAKRVRVGSNRRSLVALEWGVNWPTSKVAGHPGGIVIAPRPSARPAGKEAQPKMSEVMTKVLRGRQ